MKTKSMTLAVITTAALLIAPSVSLAGEGATTSADCNLIFIERFSPGFTLNPSSGIQDSSIETGTVQCQGMVNGHRLSGTGKFWNSGRYNNSTCLLDQATGSYFLTLDTRDGALTVDGSFIVERLGTLLKVRTQAPELAGEGSALVIPTEGNCVLAPVTEALVLMSIHFEKPKPVERRICDVDAGILQVNCRTSG